MPSQVPLPPSDYCYLVAKAQQRPDAQVFCWNIRNLLPRLPVPLRAPDSDITFDLAAVFSAAYDRGRFARKIDCSGDFPGMRSEDREWAAEIVRSGGLHGTQ